MRLRRRSKFQVPSSKFSDLKHGALNLCMIQSPTSFFKLKISFSHQLDLEAWNRNDDMFHVSQFKFRIPSPINLELGTWNLEPSRGR